MLRTLLVGNPTSQSGRNEARIQQALARMRERGWPVDFLATEPHGRTVLTLRDRLDTGDVEVVVSMGGDGTFHEVAKGILAAQRTRPMGMLPTGTANDQGRSFGISTSMGDLDRNLDIIEHGHVLRLDVGYVQRLDAADQVDAEELFFDSCGFGLHPEILSQRNRDRSLVERIPLLRHIYRDQAVYAGAAVQKTLEGVVAPSKFAAEVLGDGGFHRYEDLTDLIINGTPIYAGQWVLDRGSEPDDGFMELVMMTGHSDALSKLLVDLALFPFRPDQLKKLGIQHSTGFSAQDFDIHLLRPGRPMVSSQLDGEEWLPGDHFKIQVLRQRLPLIIPKDWTPPWKAP